MNIFNGEINRDLIDRAEAIVVGVKHLGEEEDEGLDDAGVLAALGPVCVPPGRADEVGGPHDGQVPRGHPRDLVMVREVSQVLEQVAECGEVVAGEQVDEVMKVAGLLGRRELGDAEEGLVQVVGEHRL